MTTKPPPTVLDVFLECLHVIQTLPNGKDRVTVIKALDSFAVHSPEALKCATADSEFKL
jgi:hypothetical protein